MAVFNFNERQFIGSWKRSTQLSSDGYPKAKPGAAEFKWASVAALAKDTYLADQLDVNKDPQGVEASGTVPTADGTITNRVTFADSKPASDEFPVKAGLKVVRYGTPIIEDADGKFVLCTAALLTAAVAAAGGAAGKVFLVNETVVFDPSKSATEQLDPKSLYPIAIDGGRVFEARILCDEQDELGVDVDGAAVLIADLPTLADLKAALPGLFYAR
jgi:hypothetical protein